MNLIALSNKSIAKYIKIMLQFYINDSYVKAILKAADETNLDETDFPKICEWNSTQILDEKFFPN